MAEKRSMKKLLVLLLVLAVLSLVVDLISLNVLYSLAESNSRLRGSLATFTLGGCLEDCVEEEANCWGSDAHCSEEFSRCEDDCYDQDSYQTPIPEVDYKNGPWYIESHFPYSSDYKKNGVG